jgi:pyridoxine 5-phosphate synthase
MAEPLRLSVNVDHVATVRQARRATRPDPVEAARLAEDAGADGITVHLRQDRRHIQEDDVRRLRSAIRGRLNLEMAPTEEMIRLALELRPHKVSLVPERPEEVTTEGGLDLGRQGERVASAAVALAEGGIEVAVFLDPEEAQLAALRELRVAVTGFEINTDAYTVDPGAEQLAKVAAVAERGASEGFAVYAGHGLDTTNVGPIAAIPGVEELNIGHALVARAVLIGMGEAVREMKAAIKAARAAVAR